MQNIFDVAILGAGASGLMCAGALQNKKIIVIEGNKKAGLKLLASGGGFCNFSNKDISKEHYLSNNPMFCVSALAQYTVRDITHLFYKYKVNFETRETGQLFAFSASSVLQLLESVIDTQNTRFAYDNKILSVTKTADIFEVKTDKQIFYAKNIVCALGGLSYPKLGASCAAYDIARSFGLAVTPLYPALTGIIFEDALKARFNVLAGLSLTAQVSCGKKSFTDSLLFTHDGISGPAVFKLSLYGVTGKEVKINFMPQVNIDEVFEQNRTGKKIISNVFAGLLPARLAPVLLGDLGAQQLANTNKKDLQKLKDTLTAFTFIPKTVNGYDKAEITAGGVDTSSISSKTMQVKNTDGLYFIGEALDVSGQLGGYNLHWAWASATAAAKDINAK